MCKREEVSAKSCVGLRALSKRAKWGLRAPGHFHEDVLGARAKPHLKEYLRDRGMAWMKTQKEVRRKPLAPLMGGVL